jgi:hypothetical protein
LVISSAPLVRVMVCGVLNDASNVTVAPEEAQLMALRSEPAPASFVFVTTTHGTPPADDLAGAAAASVVAAIAAASMNWPSVWANRVLLDRPDRMERGVVVFMAWGNDRKYFSRDCVVIAWWYLW